MEHQVYHRGCDQDETEMQVYTKVAGKWKVFSQFSWKLMRCSNHAKHSCESFNLQQPDGQVHSSFHQGKSPARWAGYTAGKWQSWGTIHACHLQNEPSQHELQPLWKWQLLLDNSREVQIKIPAPESCHILPLHHSLCSLSQPDTQQEMRSTFGGVLGNP
jgi:hypothetical protein